MDKFPFSDLHSFKDFIVFVRMCAPNNFPIREGLPLSSQWDLNVAFKGLREGVVLARNEKGSRPEFDQCLRLIEEAYLAYNSGQRKEGFMALDKAHKVLKNIHTH